MEVLMAEERKKEERPVSRPLQTINPFDTMRHVMNRMVDTFLEPISHITPPELRVQVVRRFVPNVDVTEGDQDVRIDVEVPGMKPEDLSVTVSGESVIIRGEKKSEKPEGAGVHRAERCYGSFRRVVSLPAEVDRDHVDATFKNGVLSIVLPKIGTAQRIPIRVEEG
jgi:HSP20 family protein